MVWPVVLTPQAILSGQVLDREMGSPVDNGFVVIEAENGESEKRVAIKNGMYSFEGVEIGTYRILAYVNGYVTGRYAKTLTLDVGDKVTDANIRVDRGLTLTGSITDTNGLALSGAVVVSRPAEGEGRQQQIQTDAKGNFVLSGLEAGEYFVDATAPGYARSFFGGADKQIDAQVIEVGTTKKNRDVNLILKHVGAIFGTVYDRKGNVLKGVQVFAEPVEGGQRHQVRASDDGTYILTGLAPVPYVVRARAEGFAPLFYGGAWRRDKAEPVRVRADGHVTGLNFALGRMSSVSGQIKDRNGKPVARAMVHLLAPAEPEEEIRADDIQTRGAVPVLVPHARGAQPVQTDKHGNYRFDAVFPGSYLLQAEAQRFSSRFYVKDSEPEYIRVTQEESITDRDVVLPLLGRISGYIRAIDKKALEDIVVVAVPVDLAMWEDRVPGSAIRFPGVVLNGKTGAFKISGLPEGRYQIYASARQHVTRWFGNVEDVSAAQSVMVSLDSVVKNVDFELTRGGLLSGQVLADDTRRPIASARVTVQRFGHSGIWQTTTDDNGAFEMGGLPNGDFFLRVEAPGFVSEFYGDTLKLEDAVVIAVKAGDPVADFRLGLARRQLADFDGNGAVDFTDLMALFQNLMDKQNAALSFDLNHDGQVDFLDFLVFVQVMQRAGKMVAGQGVLTLDQMDSESEELVAVLGTELLSPVQGFVIRVTYDPAKADYVGAKTDLGNGELTVYEEPGAVVVVGDFRDQVPATNSKILAYLMFYPKEHEIELTTEMALGMGADDTLMPLQLPERVRLVVPPQAFRLMQNVPNPFNPATAIAFELPEAIDVELAIYNLVGQRVRILVREFRPAGRYQVEWDAKDDLGRDVSSGVYFYRFQAGDFGATRRMLLVR